MAYGLTEIGTGWRGDAGSNSSGVRRSMGLEENSAKLSR
jgi:hypothetical protein